MFLLRPPSGASSVGSHFLVLLHYVAISWLSIELSRKTGELNAGICSASQWSSVGCLRSTSQKRKRGTPLPMRLPTCS